VELDGRQKVEVEVDGVQEVNVEDDGMRKAGGGWGVDFSSSELNTVNRNIPTS
jgi:hypothetical protein